MRPSDEILEALNRLYKTKLTDVKGERDFSDLLIKIGDLGANAFKLGKMSIDDAESFQEEYVNGDYIGKDNKNLSVAKATVEQAFGMAGYEVSKKNTTVKEIRQYTKTAA